MLVGNELVNHTKASGSSMAITGSEGILRDVRITDGIGLSDRNLKGPAHQHRDSELRHRGGIAMSIKCSELTHRRPGVWTDCRFESRNRAHIARTVAGHRMGVRTKMPNSDLDLSRSLS